MTEFGGNELRKARENAGIRQWQIASEIGVCEALVGRWERGEAFRRRTTLIDWKSPTKRRDCGTSGCCPTAIATADIIAA